MYIINNDRNNTFRLNADGVLEVYRTGEPTYFDTLEEAREALHRYEAANKYSYAYIEEA